MKSRERSLQFWVPEELHQALRLKAAHERKTMKEILVDLVTRCARDPQPSQQVAQKPATEAT